MGKFSIIGYMGLDSSKFVSEGKKAKTAGGKLSGFLKGAFVAGIAMAAAALVAFVAKGIKSFIEMDKKAREVFTLIPGASDEMKQKLVKGARDISQSYGIDVVEALDGMYKALSAGIPKENVVDFLKVAADAAKGGVSTLGEAVGAITTVLNGYGMEASKARDVSDILFTAVKGGSTTFGELGKNVGKVTPIASALGISFEQVGAMFADLTLKLGDGKTAEAGTQINAMLAELGKSGTVADKAFKKLSGGSFPDFIASGGDVKSAILAMRTEADANNMQMIDMFGSIEAGKAAMSMTEKGAKGLTQALKDQEERMGSTKDAAEEMKKAFADKLAVAGEKVNDIFRRVGEVLMKLGGGSGGIFDMMVGYVDVLVGYLEKASNGGGALSKVFGVLGEAMKFSIKMGGMTINIFKMMIGVFELIITVLDSLGKIYKAVFQPLFTIAEAGGKIMMAFAEAIASGFSPSAWKKFGDVVDGELDRVVDSFENWGTNIDTVMTQENKNMKKAWDGFAQSTRDSVAEIGDIWKETGNWGFLNEELMEADALNKARIEAEKIAVLEGEARAESEKRKKLAEQQAKLLGERIAKQKILNAEKERITKLLERAEATTKRIKMLEKAKVELNKKIADRKKEINAHIQKENGLQSEALGIVQNLLNQDGMRVRDKKRLWAIQAEIKKQEQKTKDASDEGFKALQETRKALLMIKDVEEQILRRKLRAKGLTEEQIDLHMKDARSITGVDKELEKVNHRIVVAERHQKRVNKLFPEAKIAVNGVAMGAKRLDGELAKAKNQQIVLKEKTTEAVKGFKEMGGEAAEIEKGLRQVGQEMDSMKFGVDDLKIDTGDVKELPETMEKTKQRFQEINDLSDDNALVKLANTGKISVNPNEPIPVTMDNVKLDGNALKQIGRVVSQTVKPIKESNKRLGSIDKTLKGYFVNQ